MEKAMDELQRTKKNLIMFPLGTVGRDMVYYLFTSCIMTFVLFTRNLTNAQFAAITAIVVAARIFDALNDPIMGNIIERTRTKWGKFKPWLIIGIVTTSFVVYFAFNSSPSGWSFVIFFGVIYFLYSITYTMHDISYWGMVPALSSDADARNQFTSRATLCAGIGGTLAGALWGMIPGMFKALLGMNEVIACIMTNWIAANLVTWAFEDSYFRNSVEAGKLGYIYKTSYNGVETAKLGLDKIFAGSQVNAGILIAIACAIIIYIIMSKTTFGYQLKACGANRHAARYAGISDKRNLIVSMAIAGALAGAGACLYTLSGNTEFFWSTYQSLPAVGFNGIPVALLASCHPIGVIFSGLFMSMLNISGLQITKLTAYNEYITDVIIAIIVYLSAFSLIIKTWLTKREKKGGKK